MSAVRQLIYRIIYHPFVNKVIRNVNKLLAPLLPSSLRIPPSGIMRVNLRTASFRFSTNQTNTTSQLLFWRGPYNIEYTVIFEELIKKCKTFYDIGAHAGYYSLLAACANRQCEVVAFEPAPGPFHYLEENITLNGLQNRIKTVKAALGDSIGTATFLEVVHNKYKYLDHNLVAVGNLASHQPNREMKEIKVPVTTLDSFVIEHRCKVPDIIKMDTEGTEHLILEGARVVLGSKPIVISETLFNTNERQLEELMSSIGYNFYNYKDGKLHPVKSIVRSADNGVHDCFFVHPEQKSLIAEFISR
jgi:FkbM family methyltransferase